MDLCEVAADEKGEGVTTADITNSLLIAICQRWSGSVCYRHNVVKAKVKMADGGSRWIRSSPDGVSDIIGMVRGRFFACELKQPGDTLTEAQFNFLRAVQKGGGLALVVGRTGLRKIPDGVPCCLTVETAMEWIERRL